MCIRWLLALEDLCPCQHAALPGLLCVQLRRIQCNTVGGAAGAERASWICPTATGKRIISSLGSKCTGQWLGCEALPRKRFLRGFTVAICFMLCSSFGCLFSSFCSLPMLHGFRLRWGIALILLTVVGHGAIPVEDMIAEDERYYPYTNSGPDDTASQRFVYHGGIVQSLDSIPQGFTTFSCSNVNTGERFGCTRRGLTGLALLDFGHQTHDVVSIGAALGPAYLGFPGRNAGNDIGLQKFRPFLWADKGELFAAIGDFVEVGPEQALTKAFWTEWNFPSPIRGLTGRVWIGLQYTTAPNEAGFMGWIFPAWKALPGSLYRASIRPGTTPDGDEVEKSGWLEISNASSMMYARTIFNCTREIQCSGNGDCENDACVCDAGWSGDSCETWLLSPPAFGVEGGQLFAGTRVAIAHAWACSYWCWTANGDAPRCGGSYQCQVGDLYTVPFVITSPMHITAVACAGLDNNGGSVQSQPTDAFFEPSDIVQCTQGKIAHLELLKTVTLRSSASGTYAPASDCWWQYGTDADLGTSVTIVFEAFEVDLTQEDKLAVYSGYKNTSTWASKDEYHVLRRAPSSESTFQLPVVFHFVSNTNGDERNGFTLHINNAAGSDGPECGNGVRHPYENCDDGNHLNNDGCDSECRIETGWVCLDYLGSKSACVRPTCSLECHNGGRCEVLSDGFEVCVCAEGWTGAQCTDDVNMCDCVFCHEQCREGVGASWYSGACGPRRCSAPYMPHVDLVDCRALWAPGDVCRPTCQKGYVGYPAATCGADGAWTYGGSCRRGPLGYLTANNSQCGAVPQRYCGSAAPCCSAGGTCGIDAAACGAGCQAAYSWGATCDLVTCGPPLGLPHWDVSLCEPVAGGACHVTCEVGFVGTPTAVCGWDGSWTYGGSCQRLCAPGYSYADGGVGGNGSIRYCSDCAVECSNQSTCRAYDCGPGSSSCNLHTGARQRSVPRTAAAGRVLCTRDAAYGCAAGYYQQTGRIPGPGMEGGPLGCVKCAELCSREPDCASYECDLHPEPNAPYCDLNTEADPTETDPRGRVFCTKRGSAWLQVEDENAWYIALPSGNSATQHQLDPAQSTTTTWTRLRVRGVITRGMAEIYVALGDDAVDVMDGDAPRFGTARECRPRSGGRPPISSYDVRLGGTPFALGRLPPAEPSGAVSVGRSTCWDAGRACAGYCGGTCGVCGLGQWGMDAAFPLAVVDRAAFDAAFPPLSEANAGCWTLQSEAACLGSRDGRVGQSFFRQRCEWCCGDACTPGGYKCEPRDWLLGQPGYTGRSRGSLGSNACPVDCGEPRRDHANFTGCEYTFGGTCRPRCRSGFTGRLTAVCGRNGLWQYSGFCTKCTDGFWKDALGYSCANYTANDWCDASGGYGRGWGLEWGTFANYAVGALSATDVCCGCGAGPATCQRLTQVVVGSSTAPSKVVAVAESVVACPAICGPGCYSGAPNASAGDTFLVTVDSGRVVVDRVDVSAPWSMQLSVPCCAPCAAGFRDRVRGIGGGGDVNDKGAGVGVSSCGDCAALCLQQEQCRWYECSDTQLQCYLGMAPNSTAEPREGYHVCSRLECGLPTLADTMATSHCVHHYGGVCDVSCRSGYTGSPTAECGPEGVWHYEGACTPILCGKPLLPHVDFSGCPHTFGGTCSPTCQDLYSGSVTAVCGADGAWTYGGSCTRVSCGPPSQPNVDFTNCAFGWGDTCQPVCVEGHVGSPWAECGEDGRWKYGGSCPPSIPTYAKDVVYPIPPQGRARSVIESEALSFKLLAVRVKVAGAPLASLAVSLEAPDGTGIDLLRDLEGCTGTDLDVTFEWSADHLPVVECREANQGVRARPTVKGSVPDLPVRQSAGYWVLSIVSSHPFLSAELLLWSLTVREPLQPCAPGFEGHVGGGHDSGQLSVGERGYSTLSRPAHSHRDRTGSHSDTRSESTGTGGPIDVLQCGDCAALCLQQEQCRWYECSDMQLQCYLGMAPNSTAEPREGYHVCSRLECGLPTLGGHHGHLPLRSLLWGCLRRVLQERLHRQSDRRVRPRCPPSSLHSPRGTGSSRL